jgi:hypothetical protein
MHLSRDPDHINSLPTNHNQLMQYDRQAKVCPIQRTMLIILPGVFYSHVGILCVIFYVSWTLVAHGNKISAARTRARARCALLLNSNEQSERLILNSSATRLASLLRHGKITSVQCCNVFLDRQSHIHSTINAVVQQRRVQALNEAEEADETIDRLILNSPNGIVPPDALPPFYGVPCSIKVRTN